MWNLSPSFVVSFCVAFGKLPVFSEPVSWIPSSFPERDKREGKGQRKERKRARSLTMVWSWGWQPGTSEWEFLVVLEARGHLENLWHYWFSLLSALLCTNPSSLPLNSSVRSAIPMKALCKVGFLWKLRKEHIPTDMERAPEEAAVWSQVTMRIKSPLEVAFVFHRAQGWAYLMRTQGAERLSWCLDNAQVDSFFLGHPQDYFLGWWISLPDM